MSTCQRCGRRHHATSALCEACWEDLGQMKFEDDEDLHFWNDRDDGEARIASVFDRAEDRL